MKDNRGLSLVELLLTVTILALVIAGAATFMLSGSRSFAKGNADSKVQSEAELAVNQIEDLVIDINGGVSKADTVNTASLVMYHVEADEHGMPVYKKRDVTWNKDNNNISYSEWNVEADGTELDQPVDNELLAKNVTEFDVDLSDTITETDKDGNDIDIVRSVVIRVGCLDGSGKAAYATTPVITLRNRLMLSGSPDKIFPATPTPDDTFLLYISDVGMSAAVPIRDRVTTVERGKMYNIYAMVSAGTNVNSLCDWQVEGEASSCLSDLNFDGVFATLDVDMSEPNDYLVITASYKTNPAKKAVGIVKVIGGNGKSLDWVKIIPQSTKEFSWQFDSDYGETNLTDDDIAHLEYTWSVNQTDWVDSSTAWKNKTLGLTILQKPETYNQVITITLQLYCPATGQTVSDSISYPIPPEGTVGGDSLMERGKIGYEKGFHADNWYSFKPPVKEGASNVCELVGYDFYICDIYGNRMSSKDYLKQYIIIDVNGGVTKPLYGGQNISYWLTIHKDLPADQEFFLKVVVNFKYADGTDWSYERIHFVSAVHIYGETNNYPLTEVGDYISFPFYYTVTGYYSNTWAAPDSWAFPGLEVPKPVPYAFGYEISYDYDAPAGVTIEPKLPDWHSNVDSSGGNGKRIKGSAGFTIKNETGKEWWQIKDQVKMHKATIKVYMKDYPNVYTYCYVNFD